MNGNKVFVLLGCLVAAGSTYLVDPPTTAPSDTVSDCSNWAVASSSDTCDSLAAQGDDITTQQFLNYASRPTVLLQCLTKTDAV